MKKLKLTLCVAFLIVASYTGYTAYEKMTMTDAEKFILENIEALVQGEGYEDYGCVGIMCRDYCNTNSATLPILWHARNTNSVCRLCGNPW